MRENEMDNIGKKNIYCFDFSEGYKKSCFQKNKLTVEASVEDNGNIDIENRIYGHVDRQYLVSAYASILSTMVEDSMEQLYDKVPELRNASPEEKYAWALDEILRELPEVVDNNRYDTDILEGILSGELLDEGEDSEDDFETPYGTTDDPLTEIFKRRFGDQGDYV